MTSYFEIGGHIIDGMDYSNDYQFVTRKQSAVSHREHRAVNRTSREALASLQSSQSGGYESPGSLFEHWKKTSFYPLREMASLPRSKQIGLLRNPILFAIWGSGKIAEVMMMHDQYLSDYVDSKTDRFHPN
jgi:hypothetical protein